MPTAYTHHLQVSGFIDDENMMNYKENADIHSFSTNPILMDNLLKQIEIGTKHYEGKMGNSI
ncbi:MAG: hypothetical protein IID18_02785 [Nitrospinae bacterium]|nr:hypothetical protein [Nitrospinota bacterium]